MSGFLSGRSRNTWIAIGAVVVVVIALVVVLTGGNKSHTATSVVSQPARTPVASGPARDPAVEASLRHGWMVVVADQPSSGLFAEQNNSLSQGVALAANEVNNAGGLLGHVRIKLLHQQLEGLSPSVVQSRLRSDAAVALVLPCDTDSAASLASAAAQSGALVLAPCNPDPQAGRRYAAYWPVGVGGNEEATGIVEFMRDLGYIYPFMVSAAGDHYVEQQTNDLRTATQRGGVHIVGNYNIALGDANLGAAVNAIKGASPSPTAILTTLPPPLVNRLGAALQAAGVVAPLVGTTAMDTHASLAGGASALENAVFASYGFPREASAKHSRKQKVPPSVRFAAAYKAMFGSEPVGSFPGLGDETIQLLVAASKRANSGLPSAIQEVLAHGFTLGGFALAGRSYKAGGNHNPIGRMGIVKVVSGHLEPIYAPTPELPEG